MRSKSICSMLAVQLGVCVLLMPSPARSENQPPPALAGQVTSTEDGPMEGVVISARKDGSTITVSVDSDGKGHYSFPGNRLVPGHYALKIRAAGYDLEGPAARISPLKKPPSPI